MSFKPTLEQENVIHLVKKSKIVKVEAVAGSGKTSTLELVTKAIHEPTLYMAFNKAMADEAASKFPSHVLCKTVHSIAFGVVGRSYTHKLNRPKSGYVNMAGTPSELVKRFDRDYKGHDLYSELQLGRWVLTTLARFEASADENIATHHTPRFEMNQQTELSRKLYEEEKQSFKDISLNELSKLVVRLAEKLWEKRTDKNSDVLITHDTYLKLYQLSKPKLDFNIVMLDEAQDANPVIVDIVMQQKNHAKVILVGDSYQQIYAWRGAVNALANVTAPTAQLTQSFRFGKEIAEVANSILDKPNFVKGFDKINSVVDIVNRDEPYTILYRTNAELLSNAIGFIKDGIPVSIETDIKGFVYKLSSVMALSQNDMKNVKHPELLGFKDYESFCILAEDDPENKRMIKLVDNDYARVLINILSNHKNSKSPQVTLTTAHKSKGREWDQVILAEDFLAGTGIINLKLTDEERNLLYVAATRAQKVLEIDNAVTMCLQGEIERYE